MSHSMFQKRETVTFGLREKNKNKSLRSKVNIGFNLHVTAVPFIYISFLRSHLG